MIKSLKKNFCEVVKIQFRDLHNTSMTECIDKAYGSNGNGIMIVQGVPGVRQLRESVLPDAFKMINMTDAQKASLERPETDYSIGYAFGKEYFKGQPDKFKCSFYATLPSLTDNRTSETIWPNEYIPGFQDRFISTGNRIREVGLDILKGCDTYLKDKLPSYKANLQTDIIKRSTYNTGRLLFYKPNIDKNKVWTAWHNDHGTFTGLLNSMYFDESGKQVTPQLSKTGLYVMKKLGQDVRVTYGPDDLAFQVGETLQIMSGGMLQATPHSVLVFDDVPKGVGRATFVLFMEPNHDEDLVIPDERTIKDVQDNEVQCVPKIKERFKEGMNFGEFNKATFAAFSENQNI